MRPILFAAAIIGATSVFASTDAMAQFFPRPPVFGFRFFGPGFYAPWFYGPMRVHAPPVRKKPGYTKHVSTKQVSTKQVSTKQVSTKKISTKQVSTKKVSTKQISTRQVPVRHGSTMRPAATTRVSAWPDARTTIPLPDRALLTPTPEFNCEFETTSVDDASGQLQGECYRHAEIILRDRLRQLQAAVRETIDAVNRSEQPAATTGISSRLPLRIVIPLPDQELLTAQPEFDCEFKTTSVDDGSDQPQPSPTRAQAGPSTDGALRMKLDYERECYRHAEMILRDRLRLLQVSIGETMKALIPGIIKNETR
jgi:hypothetical protein